MYTHIQYAHLIRWERQNLIWAIELYGLLSSPFARIEIKNPNENRPTNPNENEKRENENPNVNDLLKMLCNIRLGLHVYVIWKYVYELFGTKYTKNKKILEKIAKSLFSVIISWCTLMETEKMPRFGSEFAHALNTWTYICVYNCRWIKSQFVCWLQTINKW